MEHITDWDKWSREGQLAVLESAANAPHGLYRELAPATGFPRKLVAKGLLEVVAGADDPLRGSTTYRITDAGRAFVKANAVPAEW